MKNLNNILMLCIIASFTLFASCKKDKKDTTASTTSVKTDYLTKGPWKVTAERTKLNGGAWIDEFVNWQPCELDNTTTFYKNFTTIDDEGASKCGTTDPQSTTGNWAFNTGETSLILIDGVDQYSYTIQILDNTILRIQGVNIVATDTITYELTFGH